MRAVVAVLVVIAVVFIDWTWMFAVPSCLSSGCSTSGYSGSATSPGTDNGAFGGWPKTASKEQARQQAFDEWARESEQIDMENRARLDREHHAHRW